MTRYHATPEGQIPFTPEEEAEWDAREAAEIADAPQRQWGRIRSERNNLLARTDWWVTKAVENGALIAADQSFYRQALRDITEQENPFNITWPEKPE